MEYPCLPPESNVSGPRKTSNQPDLPWAPILTRIINSKYGNQLTSVRLRVGPSWEVFFFEDRETIKEIWKNSALMCAGKVHVLACKYLFGFPDKWINAYAADNSGRFAKPLPGTNVPENLRIHRLLNGSIEKSLTGSGFDPTLQRFRRNFVTKMESFAAESNGEWVEINDLHHFLHNTIGRSILETVFGEGLFQINPTFMDDLYEFNDMLPYLTKGLPKWVYPRPHKVRSRLHGHLKRWYTWARANYPGEECHFADGDGDPYWGSNWMRQRQKTLDILQCDDTLAAGDLGVAWASIENVVSATAITLVHVNRVPSLPSRIRECAPAEGQSFLDVDMKSLSNSPLLASIYAEVLRLHGKSFTVVHSTVEDFHLGKTFLPKGTMGLINGHVTHMDPTFWNDYKGQYPVTKFWAERFVTNPADPESGPSKYVRAEQDRANKEAVAEGREYFSVKGLEASWIPYGGGHLVCPGRFLAKNAIVLATAYFAREFEVEVIGTEELRFSDKNWGFGIESPEGRIGIRVRRRRQQVNKA